MVLGRKAGRVYGLVMDIALATPRGVALCGSDHLHIFVYYHNHYRDDSINTYLLLCGVIVKKPLARSTQKVWDELFHILRSPRESWSLPNFAEFRRRVQPSHVLVRREFDASLSILQTTNLSAPHPSQVNLTCFIPNPTTTAMSHSPSGIDPSPNDLVRVCTSF